MVSCSSWYEPVFCWHAHSATQVTENPASKPTHLPCAAFVLSACAGAAHSRSCVTATCDGTETGCAVAHTMNTMWCSWLSKAQEKSKNHPQKSFWVALKGCRPSRAKRRGLLGNRMLEQPHKQYKGQVKSLKLFVVSCCCVMLSCHVVPGQQQASSLQCYQAPHIICPFSTASKPLAWAIAFSSVILSHFAFGTACLLWCLVILGRISEIPVQRDSQLKAHLVFDIALTAQTILKLYIQKCSCHFDGYFAAFS